jgi:hypothetical protein
MNYSSIFKTKSSHDNKLNFCKRMDSLIKKLSYCNGSGYEQLNKSFLSIPFNNGFSSISDLLQEYYPSYKDFSYLGQSSVILDDECVLANIDILFNCLLDENLELRKPFFLIERKIIYK